MPELLTKYPEVVIQVLESAGARCGDGLPQKILTQCPRDSFCAMPGGETCVYGLASIGKMTQVKRAEIAQLVCGESTRAAGCNTPDTPSDIGGAIALAALVVGLAIGRWPRARARIKDSRSAAA